ncbi:voltage-dependent calcium channel gamma subunit [Holotrichia oblita]|uniref:Voltage-dependent calcium channel gamma subunit n=1 Tax=Holotrichia oblita TaxID=644536 RepID=A0ACB9SPU7_HOLOL|nr:voltage-dependent calcium channel gamma subunit [Holotrichia oblita]
MQRAAVSRSPGPSDPGEDANHLGPIEAALSCLWILTPLAATVSLLVVLVAMLTNQWLHTEEKMHNPSYNGTGDRDYLSKLTISGLWMLCFTNHRKKKSDQVSSGTNSENNDNKALSKNLLVRDSASEEEQEIVCP